MKAKTRKAARIGMFNTRHQVERMLKAKDEEIAQRTAERDLAANRLNETVSVLHNLRKGLSEWLDQRYHVDPPASAAAPEAPAGDAPVAEAAALAADTAPGDAPVAAAEG